MCRLLVSGRIVRRAVDLDQNKTGRIVLLLDDVEPSDPRLLDAVARVGDSRFLESLVQVGLVVYKNMEYQHINLLTDVGWDSPHHRR